MSSPAFPNAGSPPPPSPTPRRTAPTSSRSPSPGRSSAEPDPTAPPRSGPAAVDWWITSRCNLACDFCYGPEPARDPVRLRTRIAAAIGASSAPVVTFCGGEPLLVRPLPELARLLRERGKRLVLNTNGELLRRRFGPAADLPFDVVGISLDGPDAEVHRAMRGAAADFAASLGAAEAVAASGTVQLKIGTVVSAVNADRLERLAALVRTLRPVAWRLYQYSPWGPQNRGVPRHGIAPDAFLRTVAAVSAAAAPVPVLASATDTTGGCFIVDPGGTILRPDGVRYVPLGSCLDEPIDDLWAREPHPAEVIENKRWHGRLAAPAPGRPAQGGEPVR